MEVKIGIQQSVRELAVETSESPEVVEKLISEAVASGGLLTLEDTKGRKVVVPGAKIAYIELGSTTVGAVGFRS